jgi:dihydroneopterin aldolase
MEFFAYHGVLQEEERLGQVFTIDVDIYPEPWTSTSLGLQDTVNYAEVYAVTKKCVECERYQLIESLAEKIAAEILHGFNCLKVRVEVHKPNAPIPGIFRDVSVEIIREKNTCKVI